MRPMPVYPMVACQRSGRHEPFNLNLNPAGCPACIREEEALLASKRGDLAGHLVDDHHALRAGDIILAAHVVTSTDPPIPAGWTYVGTYRP